MKTLDIYKIDAICWPEALYTCPRNECYHICEFIKEGTIAVVEKFHYLDSVKDPEEHFHCSICNTTEHFCRLSEDKLMLFCCIDDTTEPVPINKSCQLSWFKPAVEEEGEFLCINYFVLVFIVFFFLNFLLK